MDAAAERHPDVPYEPQLIDATFALLIASTGAPLVIPALNRDGDILSDLVLPLFGSIAGSESLLVAFGDDYDADRADGRGRARHRAGALGQERREPDGDDPRRRRAALARRRGGAQTPGARSARRASRPSPRASARPTSAATPARREFTDEVIRRTRHEARGLGLRSSRENQTRRQLPIRPVMKPVFLTAARICAFVSGLSNASGAGAIWRRCRIQAACRASTEWIDAAAARIAFVLTCRDLTRIGRHAGVLEQLRGRLERRLVLVVRALEVERGLLDSSAAERLLQEGDVRRLMLRHHIDEVARVALEDAGVLARAGVELGLEVLERQGEVEDRDIALRRRSLRDRRQQAEQRRRRRAPRRRRTRPCAGTPRGSRLRRQRRSPAERRRRPARPRCEWSRTCVDPFPGGVVVVPPVR